MTAIPFQMTTLAEWKEAFPESTVVSRDSGFNIDYSITPTGVLSAGDRVYTSLPKDLRYPPGMPVLGIKRNDHSKAYPAGEILVAGGQVEESFDGVPVKIQFMVEEQEFKFQIADGDVETIQSNWSEWSKNESHSEIFQVPEGAE